MQFAEALAPEEAQVLQRFVQTEEANKALEAKFQVISLTRVIELGGYRKIVPDLSKWDGPSGLFGGRSKEIPTVRAVPNLAVCSPKTWAGSVFFHSSGRGRLGYRSSPQGLSSPSDWRGEFTVPAWSQLPLTGDYQYHAKLPVLPREARQTLEQYPNGLVLWEADWDPTPIPLGDPAIIVPIIQDLYAVAYVWDLTELEKKVLTKAFVK